MNTTAVERRKRQAGNDISGFFERDFLKRENTNTILKTVLTTVYNDSALLDS